MAGQASKEDKESMPHVRQIELDQKMIESLCQRHNIGKRQWSHGLALSSALTSSGTANFQNLRPWLEPLMSSPSSCHLVFTANTGGKIKIARDNIHDKAQIAAYRYVTRFTVFMENAITPKSRVVDYFDQIRDQPVVIKNPQRSAAHLMFYPECNDPHLNRYNRTMSLGRLANTDITPRTSLQALLNHLSEYCTKAGLIAERNYSGHEIAHMLFSPRLVNISRTVIPVDCKFALQQNQSFSVGGQECVAGRNVIQEYMERDHVYHNVSYHQVLTRFDTRGKKIRPIAREQTEDRALRYFSIYPSNP
ncbi:hypothetical protein D6D19_01858 [Aureobasidium pullulans]|uniref:Uncharacterized protein n=1 Tax=Aureobasidium pullulans TaxID=5580 RepID=A0A4S9AER2_AURPU|nr:hypothetical protein D6D19_01858 [Aureobasidium pullulans]